VAIPFADARHPVSSAQTVDSHHYARSMEPNRYIFVPLRLHIATVRSFETGFERRAQQQLDYQQHLEAFRLVQKAQ
jgi:hypothetical protein